MKSGPRSNGTPRACARSDTMRTGVGEHITASTLQSSRFSTLGLPENLSSPNCNSSHGNDLPVIPGNLTQIWSKTPK